MTPTNTYTLRSDFEATIRGIAPTFPLHQDRWKPVDAVAHTEGGNLRLFYIRMGFSEEAGDGVYGEEETTMEVWVNYSDLPDSVVDSLASQDAIDILLALENRIDPTVPGFLGITRTGSFEPQREEPGAVWGLHRFLVRYLAPTE